MPLILVLVLLELLMEPVTVVTPMAGAAVSLVTVFVSWVVFPTESVAVTVYVTVPLFNMLRLFPVIDQVPLEFTMVVLVIVCVPSLTITEIEAPISPVPLIAVLVTLDKLTGLVTEVMATAGGVASLVVVNVVLAALLPVSSELAV